MNGMSFDQILHAAGDLSVAEQKALIHLQQQSERQSLSANEKIARLRAAQVHVQVNQEPFVLREDWYDNDGR